ncbi:hypothetical protein [Streptomyces sp. NPDC054804]
MTRPPRVFRWTRTLGGAHTWATDSQRGEVVNLTGTTGCAATSGPAVGTSKSFPVSAWLDLTSRMANSTFVSRSGTADILRTLCLAPNSRPLPLRCHGGFPME